MTSRRATGGPFSEGNLVCSERRRAQPYLVSYLALSIFLCYSSGWVVSMRNGRCLSASAVTGLRE